MIKKLAFVILIVASVNFVRSQRIEIQGNNIVIVGDGTNMPDVTDGTYFSDTPINGSTIQKFTITNLENNKDITIEGITVNSSDYVVKNKIRNLKKGKTKGFEIFFEPKSIGIKIAVVTIKTKLKKDKLTYTFNIRGSGIIGSGNAEIMISQYYENGKNNDFIEIKNLSDAKISNKKYFLAHYKNSDNTSKAPKRGNTIDIKTMTSGEVHIYNKFKLEGNDIVVISTSKGKDCYKDRIDIIGKQKEMWGKGRSFSKGGCASETSHLNFDINHWIEIDVAKVDAADNRQNITLGTYDLGTIFWNGSTWSNSALPDLSRTVSIDGIYTAANGNIEACNLIINSSLNFDNGTTHSVVVYGDLTINGTFTIGNQESLVMYDDDALIIGNITKKESSTFRNNAYDITYWSSPIRNANIGTVFAGVAPNRIYLFDQSQTNTTDPSHPDYWNTWILASGNMDNGKGYAAEGISGTIGVHNISFSGSPNNGVINIDIFKWSDSDPDNDFNLIGNPYPSAIDIETFFAANSTMVDPTIYLWTHSTPLSGGSSGDFVSSDYATYNLTGGTGVGSGPVPDKNIGSGQGFFIRGINSGIAVFNNSMRIEDANNQFYKIGNYKKKTQVEEEKDRIWLNLTTNMGGFNQLLIGYMENATESMDRGYDALKLDANNPISFYSVVDNKKLVIQGLNNFSKNNSVSLGFDSEISPRTITISINRVEGVLREADIFLVDNLLNTTHDLKQSDYEFDQLEKGEFKDRFTLQFKGAAVLDVKEILKNEDFVISNLDDSFKIDAKQVVKTIKVYDMLGRALIDFNPNKHSFYIKTNNLKKGTVLILQAELENGSLISKKTIKH